MRIIAVSLPVLGAVLATACSGTPRPAASESSPVAVSVGAAELADAPSHFEAGGVVRARATAVVASRVMAPVAAVHVRPGDRVRRGAPLLTLDARQIRANNAQAAAALTSAVEAGRAAESDVRAADAAVRLARATHERIAALHAKRSATPQELDQAVAGLGAAEAQLAGAQRRAAAADAAREAARAGVEAAEVGVSYTLLSAPFDGVVTDRRVDPGSMAAPGAPLLTIEDTAMLRLEVQIDEARAQLVRVGQSADARVDDGASPDERWIGARVSEIARLDPTSHSFLVKLDLPSDPTLRPGLYGRARFAGRVRRTLTVPRAAIVRRGQLTLVFQVDADGAARLRAVTTAADGADRIEVLAGLQEGDRVVLNPPATLSDGVRINEIAGSPRGAAPGSEGRR